MLTAEKEIQYFQICYLEMIKLMFLFRRIQPEFLSTIMERLYSGYLADYEKLLEPLCRREEERNGEDILDEMLLWKGTENYSYEYNEDDPNL